MAALRVAVQVKEAKSGISNSHCMQLYILVIGKFEQIETKAMDKFQIIRRVIVGFMENFQVRVTECCGVYNGSCIGQRSDPKLRLSSDNSDLEGEKSLFRARAEREVPC